MTVDTTNGQGKDAIAHARTNTITQDAALRARLAEAEKLLTRAVDPLLSSPNTYLADEIAAWLEEKC